MVMKFYNFDIFGKMCPIFLPVVCTRLPRGSIQGSAHLWRLFRDNNYSNTTDKTFIYYSKTFDFVQFWRLLDGRLFSNHDTHPEPLSLRVWGQKKVIAIGSARGKE